MSIILKGIDPKTDYGLCILTTDGELITANGKHFKPYKKKTKDRPSERLLKCGQELKERLSKI